MSEGVHSDAVLGIWALVFAVCLNIELPSASWAGSHSPSRWSALGFELLSGRAVRTNRLRLLRGAAARGNFQTQLGLSWYKQKDVWEGTCDDLF